MRLLAAAAAAAAALLVVSGVRRRAWVDRIEAYLRPSRPSTAEDSEQARRRAAGLDWSRRDEVVRFVLAAAVGAAIVAAAAAGSSTSQPAAALVGAAAGALAVRVWMTNRIEQRRRQLAQEIPLVADALAVLIRSGESISGALEHLASAYDGVSGEELGFVVADHRSGADLPVALHRAHRRTTVPIAARLFLLLANAHHSGGRLSPALVDLARAARAELATGATSEAGKRAVATYGPILALMVPVALVFLMYPTLSGLGDLAGAP